jgi:hypothetical protein
MQAFKDEKSYFEHTTRACEDSPKQQINKQTQGM